MLFSKMKYAALAFAALCAVSPTAVADEIGSWHLGSGKDGPPAESGGLISLANDEDDRLFIRCSNNAYRLAGRQRPHGAAGQGRGRGRRSRG